MRKVINILIGVGAFAIGVVVGVAITACVVIGRGDGYERKCEKEYERGYNAAMDVVREHLKRIEEEASRGDDAVPTGGVE